MSRPTNWVSNEAEFLMVYFADRGISMVEALGIMALTLTAMWDAGEEDCDKKTFNEFLQTAEESIAKYKREHSI